jgi:mono/diheme cytochrome c family protein
MEIGKNAMMKTIVALLMILVLAAAGFLIFIDSGAYNIAASAPHFGPIRWVLETTLNNSVRAHAVEVQVPPLNRYDKEEGFRHFDRLCGLCHGAPGVAASEIGIGLRPEPPPLSDHVVHWLDSELFWITRHGFKYTGMPAFGTTHSEEQLWSVVAFLRELPNLSPEEYQSLRARLGTGKRGEQSRQEPREQPKPRYFEEEQAIIHQQAI